MAEPEPNTKTLHMVVPSAHTNQNHLGNDAYDRPIARDFVKLEVTSQRANKYGGGNYDASIHIERITRDGSLEHIVPYVSNNTTYFHIIACVINGFGKKITAKQFKDERTRRL